MANYPYISSKSSIFKLVKHLRQSFPTKLDANVAKKLGVAPNNESFLISIVRFLGLTDEEGNRTAEAAKLFSLHDDAAFQKAFGDLVESAYSDLFSLHGKEAWKLDTGALITFFRQSDQTSAIVGKRQASTFEALSALAGHAEIPAVRERGSNESSGSKRKKAKTPKKKAAVQRTGRIPETGNGETSENSRTDFGLTVRVEVNLPADGDKKTYDLIFESIRKNLIDI